MLTLFDFAQFIVIFLVVHIWPCIVRRAFGYNFNFSSDTYTSALFILEKFYSFMEDVNIRQQIFLYLFELGWSP